MFRTQALFAGLVLFFSAAVPAAANHRQTSGSFTAEAPPSGCMAEMTEARESFTAPFEGFLFVEMSDFTGDWDLYLESAEGEDLKSSTNSNDPVFGTPGERLQYWLRGGEEVDIVACNYSGGPSAEINYSLVHARRPKTPAPKGRFSRTVVLPYTGTSLGLALTGGQFCFVGYGLGCAATDAFWGMDRYVSATVTDSTGLPVAASVYQYAGEDYGEEYPFCGATDEPVKLMEYADWVGVELLVGPCLDGTPAAATTGEVELTFSSHP